MPGPANIEKDSPEEVFAVLANETRIDILRSLWERESGKATFSELRTLVGVADSGQFNYHLEKLLGRFVSRTGDGYTLTHQGQLINGALAAGSYTMSGDIEPITLDEPCPSCGGERTLHYEDDRLHVCCSSCPVELGFAIPPGVIAGCERESIPDVASRYIRTSFTHIHNGFCYYCEGRTRPSIGSLREIYGDDISQIKNLPTDLADRIDEIPWVQYACDRCTNTATAGLDLVFLDHPAVVDFYYANGVNLQTAPIWTLDISDPSQSAIHERDPFRATVTYHVAEETLILTIDEQLSVIETVCPSR